MRVNPDERPEREPGRNKLALWIGLVIVLAGLALLSYFFLTPADETPVTITAPEASTPALPAPTPATTNPVADIEETVPEQPPQPTAPELPSLDDSDEFARRQFTELTPDDQLGQWFPPNHVLRRTVSLLDGLSRGDVLRKMLRAPTPKGSFAVVQDGQKRSISPTNYQRYDYLVDTLDTMHNEKLIKLFHLLRPLLEQAYGELGYPSDSVDKAVISALDQVLATPLPLQPVYLVQDSVQYKYADPKLEALPALQKQLIRMGPEHTRRIQDKARALRESLLAD
ncbi:DUF3014 domain-containing protein [Porticoccus hydrocarbonoclasticus]|mgnify:CR=1 FL=1|jgi:hypothetical protein|uniref:DUF3014 domain-containing protein n=1 Tax=Porticoccus hydrocarbonoclasticus TaxID=1073414 RepID=UPI00055E68C9|nr:DUF3014 domain-containing protein [Porticoccus hydrocarbonoclasticus]|tara:strand:+ start:781 stop:1629 length:849 start_codon:yes stop_codon:yes gene_type:complete